MDNVILSLSDVRRMYLGAVVLYKGKPVFVVKVDEHYNISIQDLFSSRVKTVKFQFVDFEPPTKRLGMVNCYNSIVYTYRQPVRRFSIGLNNENFIAKSIDGVMYPMGRAETLNRVRSLSCPELGDTLFNNYPTLQEAIQKTQEFGGACAFDKQFAVTSKGHVIYKTSVVGTVKKTIKTVRGIKFAEGFKHLNMLLEKSYG